MRYDDDNDDDESVADQDDVALLTLCPESKLLPAQLVIVWVESGGDRARAPHPPGWWRGRCLSAVSTFFDLVCLPLIIVQVHTQPTLPSRREHNPTIIERRKSQEARLWPRSPGWMVRHHQARTLVDPGANRPDMVDPAS